MSKTLPLLFHLKLTIMRAAIQYGNDKLFISLFIYTHRHINVISLTEFELQLKLLKTLLFQERLSSWKQTIIDFILRVSLNL